MTDIERIKRLAEWMGWEYLEDEGKFIGFFRPNDNPIMIDDWNPLTRIQDAWMLLEKMDAFYVVGDKGLYACLVNKGGFKYHGDGETAVEAICQAIEKLIEEKQ